MKIDMIFETKDKCRKVYEEDITIREEINRQKNAAQAWKAAHKTRNRVVIAIKVIYIVMVASFTAYVLFSGKIDNWVGNWYIRTHGVDAPILKALLYTLCAYIFLWILIACITNALLKLSQKSGFECPAVKRMPEVSAEQKEMREKYDTFKVITRLLADSENGAAIAVAVSQGFNTTYDTTNEQSNVIVDFDNRQVIFPRD